MKIALLTVIKIFSILMLNIPTANAYTLEWQIGNRFRAFDYLANGNTAKSTKLFEIYAPAYADNKEASHTTISEWVQSRTLSHNTDSQMSPYTSENRGPWNEGKASYDPQFVKLPSSIYLKIKLIAQNNESLPIGKCYAYFNENIVGSGPCTEEMAIEDFPSTGGELSFKSDDKNMLDKILIRPRLKIILGLGDSYGAGEGSPDQPTKWKSNVKDKKWPIGSYGLQKVNGWVHTPAQWISNRCNRSYFSAQSLASLKLAADDPHSIVSFVHLSCTGAEVVDGMLAPQRNAPGSESNCRGTVIPSNSLINNPHANTLNKINPKCDVPFSQVSSAVKLLCLVKPKSLPGSDLLSAKIKKELYGIQTYPHQISWINDLKFCPVESQIKPDLVLLSIGGNDIGFGGVVAWGIIPSEGKYKFTELMTAFARKSGGVVCPDDTSGDCGGNLSATKRMDDLKKRYSALRQAFSSLLNVAENKIVISGYTNPLFNSNGGICGNPPKSDSPNEWRLSKLLIPIIFKPSEWQFNLTGGEYPTGEATLVNKWVVSKLNNKISSVVTGKDFNWLFVDNSSVMNNRGWCTDVDEDSESLNFTPNKVYTWNAFTDRTRMIRTSNDSIMTQWRSEKNHDFLFGTFHPNVQGYSGMADQIMDKIYSK